MDTIGKVIEAILDLCPREQLEVFADRKIWQTHLDGIAAADKIDGNSEIMAYLQRDGFVKSIALGELYARAYRRLGKVESFEQYITGAKDAG